MNVGGLFEADEHAELLPELWVGRVIIVDAASKVSHVLLTVQALEDDHGVLASYEMLHRLALAFRQYDHFELLRERRRNPVRRLLIAVLVREVLWAV